MLLREKLFNRWVHDRDILHAGTCQYRTHTQLGDYPEFRCIRRGNSFYSFLHSFTLFQHNIAPGVRMPCGRLTPVISLSAHGSASRGWRCCVSMVVAYQWWYFSKKRRVEEEDSNLTSEQQAKEHSTLILPTLCSLK